MAYYPIATSFEAFYRLTNNLGSHKASFNDPLDPDYVGALTEVTGLDSAEIRESAFDLTEADGGSHGNFYLGRRPIVLSGLVYGHSSVTERALRLDRARRASLCLRADGVLSWKPGVRLENLVSNPRAQNNTTSWVTSTSRPILTGGTLTAVGSVAPPVGTTAFQLSTTGSGNANQGAYTTIFLQAGVTYALSWSYRRTAGTGTGEVHVMGYDTGTPTYTVASSLTSASWSTITSTFTPSLTGFYTISFRQPNSNTLASTFQFSNIMVSPGTITTYRDGDTSGWFWNGDAGNTTSGDFIELSVNVRRQQPFRESGNWVKSFQIPLVSELAVIQSVYTKTVALGAVAENRGSFPAYPRINIVGSSTNPTVTAGFDTFRTTGLTLAAGETVQFDMLLHTGKFTAGARAGQSANRYIDWVTTAWPSAGGNGSTTTFTLSGGGSGTVLYRDAWA